MGASRAPFVQASLCLRAAWYLRA